MKYIKPSLECVCFQDVDVIKTSLQIGEEDKEDSGGAGDMGFGW